MSGAPERFTIVDSATPEGLASAVNDLMAYDGWSLHGPVLLVPVTSDGEFKFSEAPSAACYGTGVNCVFMQAMKRDTE